MDAAGLGCVKKEDKIFVLDMGWTTSSITALHQCDAEFGFAIFTAALGYYLIKLALKYCDEVVKKEPIGQCWDSVPKFCNLFK